MAHRGGARGTVAQLLGKPVLFVVEFSDRGKRHNCVVDDPIELSIYLDHTFVLVKEDFHLIGHGVIDRQCVTLVFQFLGDDEVRQVLF